MRRLSRWVNVQTDSAATCAGSARKILRGLRLSAGVPPEGRVRVVRTRDGLPLRRGGGICIGNEAASSTTQCDRCMHDVHRSRRDQFGVNKERKKASYKPVHGLNGNQVRSKEHPVAARPHKSKLRAFGGGSLFYNPICHNCHAGQLIIN